MNPVNIQGSRRISCFGVGGPQNLHKYAYETPGNIRTSGITLDHAATQVAVDRSQKKLSFVRDGSYYRVSYIKQTLEY